jgi:hypothetical protein
MIALLCTGFALVCLFNLRNELVYRRGRAIDVIFNEDDWETLVDPYLGLTGWEQPYGYTWMMFDLTKWTFEQFYPELVERERMILELEVDQERDSTNEVDSPDTKKGG